MNEEQLAKAKAILYYKENHELRQEIKRLKEEYMMLQNASDEVEEEKDKEIERLKEEIESWKRVATKNFNEAEDYKSIIKEVREYIGINEELRKVCTNYDVNGIDILEILDKEK